MRLYRQHNLARNMGKTLMALVLTAALAGALLAVRATEKYVQQEELDTVKQAIVAAAVNCYATEGFYPGDVAYLEEHYGVQIDRKKYVVAYSLLGQNTLPFVDVVRKGASSEY